MLSWTLVRPFVLRHRAHLVLGVGPHRASSLGLHSLVGAGAPLRPSLPDLISSSDVGVGLLPPALLLSWELMWGSSFTSSRRGRWRSLLLGSHPWWTSSFASSCRGCWCELRSSAPDLSPVVWGVFAHHLVPTSKGRFWSLWPSFRTSYPWWAWWSLGSSLLGLSLVVDVDGPSTSPARGGRSWGWGLRLLASHLRWAWWRLGSSPGLLPAVGVVLRGSGAHCRVLWVGFFVILCGLRGRASGLGVSASVGVGCCDVARRSAWFSLSFGSSQLARCSRGDSLGPILAGFVRVPCSCPSRASAPCRSRTCRCFGASGRVFP